MRHHVAPPISAYHDLNRDNFEPNIDSVGTHRNGWRRLRDTPYTLPAAPASGASDRPPAQRAAHQPVLRLGEVWFADGRQRQLGIVGGRSHMGSHSFGWEPSRFEHLRV